MENMFQLKLRRENDPSIAIFDTRGEKLKEK